MASTATAASAGTFNPACATWAQPPQAPPLRGLRFAAAAAPRLTHYPPPRTQANTTVPDGASTSYNIASSDTHATNHCITCGARPTYSITCGASPTHSITCGARPTYSITCGARPTYPITCGARPTHSITCGARPTYSVTCGARPTYSVTYGARLTYSITCGAHPTYSVTCGARLPLYFTSPGSRSQGTTCSCCTACLSKSGLLTSTELHLTDVSMPKLCTKKVQNFLIFLKTSSSSIFSRVCTPP